MPARPPRPSDVLQTLQELSARLDAIERTFAEPRAAPPALTHVERLDADEVPIAFMDANPSARAESRAPAAPLPGTARSGASQSEKAPAATGAQEPLVPVEAPDDLLWTQTRDGRAIPRKVGWKPR